MATKEQVDRISAECVRGLAIDKTALISRPTSWGTLDFTRASPHIENIYEVLGALKTLPTVVVPSNDVAQLGNEVKAAVDTLTQIDKFSLDAGGQVPTQLRDQLVEDLKNRSDSLYRIAAAHIPYMAYKRGDIEAKLSSLEDTLRRASKLFGDGENEISEKRKSIDDALKAARDTAANAGAAVFTQDFKSESDNLETSAQKWLTAAGVSAGLSVLAAILAFTLYQPPIDASIGYIIQNTLTKFFVVGGFLAVAAWLGSVYRAIKHQAAINRHRANGLKTFQAFLQSAGDAPEVRNAILLETTRSIFAIAPTGFLHATESNVDNGAKISDLAKLLTKAG